MLTRFEKSELRGIGIYGARSCHLINPAVSELEKTKNTNSLTSWYSHRKRLPARDIKLALDSLRLPKMKSIVELISKTMTDTLVLSLRINRMLDGAPVGLVLTGRSSLVVKTCLKASGLISGRRNAHLEASAR